MYFVTFLYYHTLYFTYYTVDSIFDCAPCASLRAAAARQTRSPAASYGPDQNQIPLCSPWSSSAVLVAGFVRWNQLFGFVPLPPRCASMLRLVVLRHQRVRMISGCKHCSTHTLTHTLLHWGSSSCQCEDARRWVTFLQDILQMRCLMMILL